MKIRGLRCMALTVICLAMGLVTPGPMAMAETTIANRETTPDITPLTAEDCSAMQAAHVISERNPLPCRRLARVRFSYIDFDGQQKQDGGMIVMDALAPYVQRLLAQLYATKFPLHSARALTHYAGDDAASMADNNSSAFNGRPITGGSSWSKHAYGAAIDINPLQNPYISHAADGQLRIEPTASAAQFADRNVLRSGMAETVRGLFADNGFLIWGGNWREPIDYQHFEIGDRVFIEKLTRSTPKQASELFERYVRTYRNCIALRAANAAYQAQCAQKTMRSAY